MKWWAKAKNWPVGTKSQVNPKKFLQALLTPRLMRLGLYLFFVVENVSLVHFYAYCPIYGVKIYDYHPISSKGDKIIGVDLMLGLRWSMQIFFLVATRIQCMCHKNKIRFSLVQTVWLVGCLVLLKWIKCWILTQNVSLWQTPKYGLWVFIFATG